MYNRTRFLNSFVEELTVDARRECSNKTFFQILGMGSKRLLTLTHRAQVKRFTQDLLKLLKSQASKQVIVREFLHAYHW